MLPNESSESLKVLQCPEDSRNDKYTHKVEGYTITPLTTESPPSQPEEENKNKQINDSEYSVHDDSHEEELYITDFSKPQYVVRIIESVCGTRLVLEKSF